MGYSTSGGGGAGTPGADGADGVAGPPNIWVSEEEGETFRFPPGNLHSDHDLNVMSVSIGSGNFDDWNPTGYTSDTDVILVDPGTSTLRSLVGGVKYRRLFIFYDQTGIGSLTIANNVGTGAATNRFFCPNSTDFQIPPLGMAELLYMTDSSGQTGWHVVNVTGYVANNITEPEDLTVTGVGSPGTANDGGIARKDHRHGVALDSVAGGPGRLRQSGAPYNGTQTGSGVFAIHDHGHPTGPFWMCGCEDNPEPMIVPGPKGDTGATGAPGGGGGSWTRSSIPAFTGRKSGGTFTLTDATISGTSKIIIQPDGVLSGGHRDDIDDISYTVVAGSGQATIHWKSATGYAMVYPQGESGKINSGLTFDSSAQRAIHNTTDDPVGIQTAIAKGAIVNQTGYLHQFLYQVA